jgi:Cu2+-exporting ATPase
MQPPATVWQIVNGVETKVEFHDLAVGDVIVVTAGEAVPVDGQVTDGEGAIDQHLLTGESALSEKTAGDMVLANTLLVSGRLEIQIEKAGKETAAAQIGEILIRASGADMESTARTEQFVDKLTPFLVLSGGVAFAMQGLAGPIAIFNSGLTTPLMSGPLNMLTFLNIASEQGILIKDGRSLERLRKIDTVIFDKTGTLTMEDPRLMAVLVCDGWTEREVLSTAAMAEHRQSHPIARAILAAAAEEGIEPAIPETAAYSMGMGVRVETDGCSVSVGSSRFLDRQGIVLPAETDVWREEVEAVGGSLVFVAVNDVCAGAVRLEVQLRPETDSLIAALKARGMRIYILSGDARRPTEHLGDILGVDGVFAEVLPTDKQTVIEDLQAQGRRVCFVGDGLNDALALRQADVSISIRGATTLATDSAQIVLMSFTLSPIEALFDLGKAFEHNFSRTLRFAFIPAGTVVGGVMFFGLGVPAAVMLFSVGIVSSVASALAPRYQDRAHLLMSSGNKLAVKEGKNEGIKEGEAAGSLAVKEEIARNLKALGTLTKEQIANVTGLSLEAIKAL